jgi:hypothetical protein
LKGSVSGPRQETMGTRGIGDRMSNFIDQETRNLSGTPSFNELRNFKTNIRSNVNFAQEPSGVKGGFRDLGKAVENRMDGIINGIEEAKPQPGLMDQNNKLNDDFGFWKTANDLAQDKMLRLQRGNILGIPDMMAGGAGGVGAMALGQHSPEALLAGLGTAAAYKGL